jgi:hypothetical protein
MCAVAVEVEVNTIGCICQGKPIASYVYENGRSTALNPIDCKDTADATTTMAAAPNSYNRIM